MYKSPLRSKKRFPFRVAVHCILIRNNKVLLLRRHNTGWGDGQYTVPAGHLDGNESVLDATVRETVEEVCIRPKDLQFVCAMHCRTKGQPEEYMNYFFKAEDWYGQSHNGEPNKCDHVGWFSLDSLPENTLPFIRQGLENMSKNIQFSEFVNPEGDLS